MFSSDCRTVSVLSFNTFCRPPGIHTNEDDYKNERLDDIVTQERFRPYDIVCLQELFRFGSSRQRAFIERMRACGFLYSVAIQNGACEFVDMSYDLYDARNPSWWPPSIIDGGVVILSKYPFVRAREIRFANKCGYDALAKKGCVHVRVNLSNKCFLDVYNVHLQSISKGDDQERLVQWSQIQELKRFIASGFSDDCNIPAVLCGDFNIDGRMEIRYKELKQQLSTIPIMRSGTKDILAVSLGGVPTMHCVDAVRECWEESEHGSATATAIPRPLVTYGDRGRDTVLTAPKDRCLMERLDYIWLLERPLRAGKSSFLILSGGVEEFGVEPRPNKPYRFLSDHFGVHVTLSIHQ